MKELQPYTLERSYELRFASDSNTFKENSFGEEKFNDSLQIESDVTETTEKNVTLKRICYIQRKMYAMILFPRCRDSSICHWYYEFIPLH